MTADEFLNHYEHGRKPIRNIADIVKQWDQEHGGKSCDDATGMTTMLTILGVDAAVGDGLLNEISPELATSMSHLMGEKADTYDEARKLIAEKISHGDKSFAGFVNKIKGQIGEDRFIQEYPEYNLALSKSQEGVDALRDIGNGFVDAVQIKMYSNPDAVVRHMLAVHEKVENGLSVQGELIGKLNFAVPENIADAVRSKASAHPELANIDILTVKSSAEDVANVVRDAADNIAHPLTHLGEEVMSSIAFMVALDILTNAYLVTKGKKSIGDVAQESMLKTPIGMIAITASKGTAMILVKTGVATNPIALPILVAIAMRKLAQNWYDHRSKFTSRLTNETEWLSFLSAALLNKNIKAISP
jgi:hypothetical protein